MCFHPFSRTSDEQQDPMGLMVWLGSAFTDSRLFFSRSSKNNNKRAPLLLFAFNGFTAVSSSYSFGRKNPASYYILQSTFDFAQAFSFSFFSKLDMIVISDNGSVNGIFKNKLM